MSDPAAAAAGEASGDGAAKDVKSLGELTLSQKAAALVMSIGIERMQPALALLPRADQETLTSHVAMLGEVPAEEGLGIIEDFVAEVEARKHILRGSVETARNMLYALRGVEADEIMERLLATVHISPFRFLYERDTAEIAQYLNDDSPQTAALVLSSLPSGHAARVIMHFEEEHRSAVARAVAEMNTPDPDTLELVEDTLKERFGDRAPTGASAGDEGVRDLASILNNTDRSVEKDILRRLEVEDPELAEEVRSHMFVFEDIARLDDRSIQRSLREVDQERLVVALKGVTEQVRGKVLRNLSERARISVEEDLDVIGPVRTQDVDRAQAEVVAIIRRLDESGDIFMRRGIVAADVID